MKKKLLILILILISVNGYSQCAMCKAVVESGGEEMAEGINSGITYLMAFPYLLVGALGYFLYRYKKRTEN